MYSKRKKVVKINDYTNFVLLLERMVSKSNRLENKQRNYGTDAVLSRAEIHTIVAVGDNPGINITGLADVLGITKGATSQMIYKLVSKGTVDKNLSPDSNTEVALYLTDEGQKNYVAHREYHNKAINESLAEFKYMPESSYLDMIAFLSAIEKVLDKKLEEK